MKTRFKNALSILLCAVLMIGNTIPAAAQEEILLEDEAYVTGEIYEAEDFPYEEEIPVDGNPLLSAEYVELEVYDEEASDSDGWVDAVADEADPYDETDDALSFTDEADYSEAGAEVEEAEEIDAADDSMSEAESFPEEADDVKENVLPQNDDEMEAETDAEGDGLLTGDGDDLPYGEFENGVHWDLTGGKLTVSGSGPMEDFYNSWTPWAAYAYNHDIDITSAEVLSGVTTVGNHFFDGLDKLTSVVLPDTIRTIGKYAFYGCHNLAVPKLPAGLRDIDDYAFGECGEFVSIELPEGLERIGYYAFYCAVNLSHVSLPASLNKLEPGAFDNTLLTTVGPAGGGYCLELPWGEGLEIPEGIFFSDGSALWTEHYAPFESIVFPDGITTLPDGICQYSTRLKEIILSDSITVIKAGAFRECHELEEVDFSENLNLELIEDGIFDGDIALERVFLPDQVQIGTSLFSRCQSLIQVHLPDSLTILPDDTFEDCNSLLNDSFEWPSGLMTIGCEAFEGCASLDNLTIPDKVTKIESYAFRDCTGLTRVYIPESVTSIGYRIFTGCTSLRSASYAGDTGSTQGIVYEWKKSIPEYAFSDSSILRVSFPETMEVIGDGAFSECSDLAKVILPEKVTIIGFSAFSNCKSLERIHLPRGLKEVNTSAFSSCDSLTHISFRGDAPQFYGGIFNYDHITAFYPGTNPTWTEKVRDTAAAEDDVNWKPAGIAGDYDLSREREATLNYAGTVHARFYLVDENGDVMPDVRFRYTRTCNGIMEQFDNNELVTEEDGSFVFSSPYLDSGNGECEVVFENFELLSDEETALEEGLSFTLNITVEPLLYTESWSTALGMGGALFDFAKGNASNSAKIELEHRAGGGNNLKLSITLTEGLAAEISAECGKIKDSTGMLSVTFGKGSRSAGDDFSKTFSTTITGYNSGNRTHQEIVMNFLGLMILADTLAMPMASDGFFCGSLVRKALAKKLSEGLEVSFDKKGESVKVKVNNSFTVVSLKEKASGAVFGSLKLGEVSGETTYSHSVEENESDGKITFSSGLKSENFFSAISGLTMGLAGVKGLYGMHEVNNLSASADFSGVVRISCCEYNSGLRDVVGCDEVLKYRSFSASDKSASEIKEHSAVHRNLLLGDVNLLKKEDWEKAAEAFAKSSETVSWTDNESMSNSYSFSPGLSIVDGKLSGNLKFSFTHEISTKSAEGVYRNGVELITADSSTTVQRYVNFDNSGTDLAGVILTAPLNMLESSLSSAISTVTHSFGQIVTHTGAAVKTSVVAGENFFVSLIGLNNGTRKSTSPMRILTFADPDEDEAASLVGNGAEEGVEAVTVGEAFRVMITNEDGNPVEEIPDEAEAELSLPYKTTDLTAADADAAEIAIYRLDEESGCYRYIGGTVDTTQQLVRAGISEGGEYLLAVHGAGASVTDVTVRESRLTAVVRAFTGISSIDLYMDGTLNQRWDWMDYDRETGDLSAWLSDTDSGEHTIVFRVTDGTGNVSDIPYTFKQYEWPKIQNLTCDQTCWPGEDILLTAEVNTGGAPDEETGVYAQIELRNGEETASDRCDFVRNGDVWTAAYHFPAGFSGAEFRAHVETPAGYSESYAKRCSLSPVLRFEMDGMNISFDLRNGKITSIETNNEIITIPDQIRGHTVTGIGAEAADGLRNLRELVIPASVKNIGMRAFRNCGNLSKLTLSEGLETVGMSAFSDCPKLKSVTIPSSVKTIGQEAFGYVNDETVSDFTISAAAGSAGAQYYAAYEEERGSGGENPDNPGDDPGDDPGHQQGGNSGTNTGGNPGGSSGNNPGSGTGGNPGGSSGSNPGTGTGGNPGGNGKAVNNGPGSLSAYSKTITAIKADKDIPGSEFKGLMLKAKKWSKNSVTLSWVTVSGAKTYAVFGAPTGQYFAMLDEVTGLTYTASAAAGKYYKYMVLALDGNKQVVSVSKTVFASTKGGKSGNIKSIKVTPKKVSLKIKKSKKLKASLIKEKGRKVKNYRKVKYESSDPSIATVSSSGKIKAKKKGKCTIYAYTQTGNCVKIKVSVNGKK